MAELIPLDYRIRALTRLRMARWSFWAAMVTVACGVSLATAYGWQLRTATALDSLRDQYRSRSALIQRSQELRSKRESLAVRMATIQQLMDDKVLLALLHSIANGFSQHDSLEYIHIDTGGESRDGKPAAPGSYTVRISGVTSNSTTLAELMTRLSKTTQPGVTVLLDTSKRESYLDGQVMRFQITCERPNAQHKS